MDFTIQHIGFFLCGLRRERALTYNTGLRRGYYHITHRIVEWGLPYNTFDFCIWIVEWVLTTLLEIKAHLTAYIKRAMVASHIAVKPDL